MRSTLIRAVLLPVALAVVSSFSVAQVKVVTIIQLQKVPVDSLKKLDTLQAATSPSSVAHLDDSPYWHGADPNGDTVQITGYVMVKPSVLTYTLARYNIYLQDTTANSLWAGLNVLTNDTSAQAQSTGITALDTGMVVTMQGKVTEFGSQNNSLTEMFHYSATSPIYTNAQPISIVTGVAPRPAPKELALDSLAFIGGVGGAGGTPKPSSAEQYESMYVIVRNVTVISVDYSSGRFSFQDGAGHVGYMYDGSGWFTLRGHRLSGSKYAPPPVGTTLNFLRGLILPQTRTGTCGDYTVMPLYPGPQQKTSPSHRDSVYGGDLSINSFAPQISAVSAGPGFNRTPSPPKRTDVVNVKWIVHNINGGGHIDSSFFNWRFGSTGTWTKTKIAATSGDSSYQTTIPAANGDSLVSYYVEAYGGGIYGASPDPSVPYFYQIRQSGLTIHDLQFTPYVNGVSGFVGDTVTVSGTVTVDTSDIKDVISSRPRLWMAQASGQWNGMSMYGKNAGVGLDTLLRGDSVSVTGIVDQINQHTNIQALSRTILQRGVTVPAPVTISWASSPFIDYALNNMPVVGTSPFEPYEGVLVKTPTPTYLVQMNADNANNTASSNFGEFFVGSSKTTTFGLRVDDNGTNSYYADTSVGYRVGSNAYATVHPTSPPKTILIPVGASITSITGIMDITFGEYKLEPRKNSDFGTITGVVNQEPGLQPKNYELRQNFPNPFNPSTTIQYSIPIAGHVTLKIYNLLGQEVNQLVDREQTAGSYSVVFDASRLASGIYFYQLKTDGYYNVKKMVLLK